MGDVVDKIRSLLRVRKEAGATEGEVANAMAIASKLMLKHNISEADIGVEKDEEDLILGKPEVFGYQPWISVLGVTIGQLYSCRHVCDPNTGVHTWAGRSDNVEAAHLTMRWVIEQIDALYKTALAAFGGKLDKMTRANFRQSFKEAAAHNLRVRVEKITAAVRGDIPSDRALVVVNQMLTKADEALSGMGAQMKQIATRRSPGLGTAAGWYAGDAVQLQRGVDDKD